MKALEILLRLIDNLLTAISLKKAQNERSQIESNPADWFSNHFGGVPTKPNQANKTDSESNPSS